MNKSNSISSDTEATITPLAFGTLPPAPRQSLVLRLRGSSYLFPETLVSPPPMTNGDGNGNDDASDGQSENSNNEIKGVQGKNEAKKHNLFQQCLDEVLRTNKKSALNEEKKQSNIIKPCSSHEVLRPRKKSVRFDDKVDFHMLLDTPRASNASSKEKRARWYGANQFDQFKYEAAKHAGLKIVRYDSEKIGQSHQFAMMGDFDLQNNDTDTRSASTKSSAKKLYYNENEYNDTHNSKGETVCKRGLGYHFSRNRKKSRSVTRSAVVAWQKTLRDPANQNNPEFLRSLPSLGGAEGENSGVMDKTRAMLALVSSKCSRVARMEAKWRGGVDCRVAYPERNDPAAMASTASASDSFRNEKSDPANGTAGKRDGARIFSDTNNAKRRKIGIGGCQGIEGRASPAPIGCLGNVLQAEV